MPVMGILYSQNRNGLRIMGQAHCQLLHVLNKWERVHNGCIMLVVAHLVWLQNLNTTVSTTGVARHGVAGLKLDYGKN